MAAVKGNAILQAFSNFSLKFPLNQAEKNKVAKKAKIKSNIKSCKLLYLTEKLET
jgi:hypothetical protein